MKILISIAVILASTLAFAQTAGNAGVVCVSQYQQINQAFSANKNGSCMYWAIDGSSQLGTLSTVNFNSEVICPATVGAVVLNGSTCPQGGTINTLAKCKDARLCF